MHSFADRLKELRIQKNLTQKQLAERFGVTERGYQNYEIGKSTPHFDVLIALADFFDVSIDYLVGRCDDPKINKKSTSSHN